MTKNFDTLLESMLGELLSEAPIAMDSPETTKDVVNKIVNNIVSAEGKGHWYNALNSKELKTLKENPEKVKQRATELVWDIVKIILPERDNTYNPDITRADLKKGDVLKDAIRTVFKMGDTHSKFLRDRFSNDALLGLVKDVVESGTENSEDGSGVQLVAVAPEVTTQKQEREQIKKSTEEFNSPEGQRARLERSVQKRQTPLSAEFSITATYQLNNISERDLNLMSEEERSAYESLYDEATGRELRDAVKGTGYTVSKIESLLQKFINKGIITPKEEESGEKDFEEGDTGEVTSGVDVDELSDIAGSFDDTINSFSGSKNWDD